MPKPFPVVHFELPYEDAARMKTFYETAFGWTHRQFGPEMGNYVVAHTTEDTSDGPPNRPGCIDGGYFEKNAAMPWSHPSLVIAVDDIRAAMAEVTSAGGKVHGEPMAIPGVGDYVSFADPEGNTLSMLQPAPRPEASS